MKQSDLELEVTNFGPIVKAKIGLRPLTVFVGPSNTGKSYLAILIYALHRFFSGFSTYRHFRELEHQKLSETTIEAISEWAQQTLADNTVEKSLVLPELIVDEIYSVLHMQGNLLGREINRCFGIDENDQLKLIRKGSRSGAHFVLRSRVANGSASLKHRLTLKAQGTVFEPTPSLGTSLQVETKGGDRWREYLRHLVEDLVPQARREERDYYLGGLIEPLTSLALPQLVGPLYRPAFYLPADRTGVMHAHRVVVSAMIGSAPMAGLRPAAGTPMLSGVLADFLQQLVELDSPPYWRARPRFDPSAGRRARSQGDFGTKLEDALLGGSVRVNRSETISYPHFTYQPKGWKTSLPLMNASSMVSELAPVVLYLRHMVSPDDVLIIEEPESHLHPAMQVEFTRQLAALIHAGIRVIITTHSDWVLETLANLVRRSALPKAQRQGDLVLSHNQVGAWLFKQQKAPKAKGSVVEEIRFDPDAGGLESGYSEVAEQLYNEWADIGNQITESNEQ